MTAAVGIGVALSLLLQLNREALDLRVVELVHDEEGRLAERPAPTTLRDRAVTVLDVYGSLFYAGARTLQVKLPDPTGATSPVVVLRLRGRTTLGATALAVIADYAQRLADSDGKLDLSGVSQELLDQIERSRRIKPRGPIGLHAAVPVLGVSTREAVDEAQAWLIEHQAGGEAS